MLPVLVIVPDLIFSTKVHSTAKTLNIPTVGARTLEAVAQRLAEGVSQVILDLNAHTLDPLAAIKQIKATANPPKIIAFLSHVQVDLAAAARQEGADEVLPRSAFTTRLPELLQSAAPPQ